MVGRGLIWRVGGGWGDIKGRVAVSLVRGEVDTKREGIDGAQTSDLVTQTLLTFIKTNLENIVTTSIKKDKILLPL